MPGGPSIEDPSHPAAPPDPPGRPDDTDHPPTDPQARKLVFRRQIVAWMALVAFLTTVVWSDGLVSMVMGAAPPGDPVDLSTPEFEFVGKSHVAIEQLAPGMGVRFRSDALDQFETELNDLVLADTRSPGRVFVRAFRARVIAGEFEGAEHGAELMAQLAGIDQLEEDMRNDAVLMVRVYKMGAESLTAEQRERLLDRHGWIGGLGASYGLPDADPFRASVVKEAIGSIVGLMLISALFVAGLVAGFALFITAAILASRGTLRAQYKPDLDLGGRRHTSFLEAVALFFGGLALLKVGSAMLVATARETAADPGEPNPFVMIALSGVQWLLFVPALWPLLRGVTWKELRRAMGWHWGGGLVRESFCGVVGYLAGIPVIAIGYVITILLVLSTGQAPNNPLAARADGGLLEIILLYSLATVWAPIVEESFFRGALHHHLRRWVGPLRTSLLVSLLFALAHPQGIAAVPVLMCIALVFSGIREWRSSIIGCMAAHALHNGVLVTLFVVTLM